MTRSFLEPRPVRTSEPAAAAALFLVHAEDLAGAWESAVPSVLSEQEQTRAAQFHLRSDRDTYVAVHFALRLVLGRVLDLPSTAVPLVRHVCPICGAAHGRPGVAGDPVHFSLSHSGGTGLVAIASTPVGVDLEAPASDATVTLLSPRLHPAERAELSVLPESERRGAFARVWCRKEAYLKGIGTGLSRPLSSDYVGATELPSAPPGWQITDVALDTSHLAALAVQSPGPQSVTSTDVVYGGLLRSSPFGVVERARGWRGA